MCERWMGGKVGFWGEEYSPMPPKSDAICSAEQSGPARSGALLWSRWFVLASAVPAPLEVVATGYVLPAVGWLRPR